MKIKKGEKFGIEHNKKLFWIIIILLALLVILILVISKNRELEVCEVDEDCVPSSCCHADSCVPKDEAPDCGGSICTMVCSGPLDCGAGHCGCVKGQCKIISKK